jgi:hypothetical protein
VNDRVHPAARLGGCRQFRDGGPREDAGAFGLPARWQVPPARRLPGHGRDDAEVHHDREEVLYYGRQGPVPNAGSKPRLSRSRGKPVAALCLAESLVERQSFDPVDQLTRYVAWFRNGHLSSTGRCFDIGTTTQGALEAFERTGAPYCGSSEQCTWQSTASRSRSAPGSMRAAYSRRHRFASMAPAPGRRS